MFSANVILFRYQCINLLKQWDQVWYWSADDINILINVCDLAYLYDTSMVNSLRPSDAYMRR